MKFIEAVFSPTGGTKRVADIIMGQLGKFGTIDLTEKDVNFSEVKISSDDIVMIAVPSFGGLSPITAIERIGELNGNGAKCVLVAVYGNREYEDTLTELEDTAINAGFKPIAAVAAIAEHSIARTIAEGRPDRDDETKLKAFGDEIAKKLQDTYTQPVSVPGNRPHKERKIGPGRAPQVSEECLNCGTCAELCPTGAIDPDDVTITDANKCISCMRCIAVCSFEARSLPEGAVEATTKFLSEACPTRKEPQLFL
jgi:ferredoxin